tara:strand:- start:9151 stop:9714 length:564 start_codon:yes stop_codon:yes gene_type:complete
MLVQDEISKTPDPFGAAIPGESLTRQMGQLPYETPPDISDPQQAYIKVLDSILRPQSKTSILYILDAGISCETVVSSIVLKMFTEGMITPDVAEIIKPALVLKLTEVAVDAGINDVNVVNEFPNEDVTASDSLEMMKAVSPQKYEARLQSISEPEIMSEELMNEDVQFNEQMPSEGSFLDMEIEDNE